MESVVNSKSKKQRKFLLVLPILVVPFLTMAFWALGGGKGNATGVTGSKKSQGLNLDLPSAIIKDDKDANKLSFYEKAKLNDEKNLEAMRNDPYYRLTGADSNELVEITAHSPTKFKFDESFAGLNNSPIHPAGYSDPNEAKIMSKVSQLQQELNKPQKQIEKEEEYSSSYDNGKLNGDIDRLGEMMTMLKEKQTDDPEMQKLEGMLDKIMDVQHPERVREKIREKSTQEKENVFTVDRVATDQNISLFGNLDSNGPVVKGKENGTGFYGLNDSETNVEQNTVEAVVHETQTVVNGSIVKLRLLDDVYINGNFIPKDNFLFGTASLDGERLKIEIISIRYKQSLFPVKLVLHDLDGLEGIYIPGAITRDVAKQSVDDGVQNLELTTLNSSIKAQATATGINAAKSLLTKKAKLIKVTIKAGYRVLLLDNKN